MASRKTEVFSDQQIDEAARLFAVLSDASRLRLLKALMVSEHTVGELVEITGLSQANVSKHLAMLHGVHFVERRKQGNFVIYKICDPVIGDLCTLVCGRIQNEAGRLARLLAGS